MTASDDLFSSSVTSFDHGSLAAFGSQAQGETTSSAFRQFTKGQTIFGDGDRTDCYYRIATGAVRSCKLRPDGRRQIVAFYLVDEIFGIEGRGGHCFSAEAVSHTKLEVFPVSSDDLHTEGRRGLTRAAFATVLHDLDRAQHHTLMLGRAMVSEKLAYFLLDMAERLQGDAYDLPMSRSDIGDYLGLTIETVSRTFQQFARAALIRLASQRRVVLLNKPALRHLQAGTAFGMHRA